MSVRSLLCVAAALYLCSLPAEAAPVCRHDVDLDIPATTEGLYINLLDGVSAPAESGAPGFDVDPYASASTSPADQLRFYWGASSTGNAGVVSAGDSYAVLAAGASIGPQQLFSRAGFTGDTSAWRAGVVRGNLGLRFHNEASGTINYGWLLISTTAGLGFPMTVHGWCFDDSGAAVTIPADALFADGYGG